MPRYPATEACTRTEDRATRSVHLRPAGNEYKLVILAADPTLTEWAQKRIAGILEGGLARIDELQAEVDHCEKRVNGARTHVVDNRIVGNERSYTLWCNRLAKAKKNLETAGRDFTLAAIADHLVRSGKQGTVEAFLMGMQGKSTPGIPAGILWMAAELAGPVVGLEFFRVCALTVEELRKREENVILSLVDQNQKNQFWQMKMKTLQAPTRPTRLAPRRAAQAWDPATAPDHGDPLAHLN